MEHMGTETPKENVGDSIITEMCFHINHQKRERMYICPYAQIARNNQHIFNFNHIQLKEGIQKQQATNKTRHEGAKKASHSTYQDSQELKQYEQRERHTTMDDTSTKVPDTFTTKANDTADTMDKKNVAMMAKS